jgi:hypothetical protein
MSDRGYRAGLPRSPRAFRSRLLMGVLVLAFAAAVSAERTPAAGAPGTMAPPGAPEVGTCDRIVPRSQREVTSATPGSVLCLEAGRRGPLRLSGLVGSAQQPITVVNQGGVVEIDAPGAYAGIEIEDSQHLRVTGAGVAERCGARFAEAEQDCGIRIGGSGNGLTGKVRTQHLTVDHVEVGDVTSAGMGVHDKELERGEWTQRDIAFRDVYLHDIGTEGHYHGASTYTSGGRILLDGVEIVRNLVVRTGRDGIQVGSAPWNCLIAGNVVAETGGDGERSHAFGIIVNRGAACDVVGNRIADAAGDGIYDQGLHGQTIADNTILRSGSYQDGAGINVRRGDQASDNPETPDFPRSTHVLGNRIAGTSEHGIRLRDHAGTDNRIHDNHVTDVASGSELDLGPGGPADAP